MSLLYVPCIAGTMPFGPIRDPHFSKVVLLLHGEGGSIVDSSRNPKTITNSGSTISTADKKFGASSIFGNADTTTNNYFSVAMGDDGEMTGDFTWETWKKHNNIRCIFYAGTSPTAHYLYNSKFYKYTGANVTVLDPFDTEDANWVHLAISRTGSTIRGFVDGVESDSSTYSDTIDFDPLRIGYFVPNSNLHYIGYIDEMRITKGVGRYTTNFTPPSRAFPNS